MLLYLCKVLHGVFFSLRDKEISMSLLNDLNIIDEEIKEQRIVEILKDFESNRYLYDNFYIKNLSSDDPHEIEYFFNKYNELINSNFFLSTCRIILSVLQCNML